MKFEKISYEQAIKDNLSLVYDKIKLPRRATKYSAGYDIYSPFDFVLYPGKEIKIPTGIHVSLDKDKFLMIVPRSGLGFKFGVRLANTVGVIDSDYINSDNEGHIWVKLSYSILDIEQRPIKIFAGDAICQGIICPFYKTEDDNTEEQRNGGFGSTDKK